MKKNTLIAVISIFSFGISIAQNTDILKEVTKNYILGKLEPAKVEMDKVMAIPTNATNPELLIWSIAINAEIINDTTKNKKYPNLINDWLNDFKKYESLDPTYTQMSSAMIGWKPLAIMYNKFFNHGIQFFQKEKWSEAFENFTQLAHLAKVIMKKDLKKNGGALDTIPFLYSGYSAQNARKTDDALHYYSFLIDNNYSSDKDLDIYLYMLGNYIEKKDKANFDKYLTIAKEKYPKEDFEGYQLEFIAKNMDIDEKIEYYDLEDAKGTLTGNAYSTFGDNFAAYKKTESEDNETGIAKSKLVLSKAIDAFKKAYEKSKNVLSAFNAGVLMYNTFTEFDDAYRDNVRSMQIINSSKPNEKDPKKRAAIEVKVKEQIEPLKKTNAEIETKMNSIADDSVIWLEITANTLKDQTEKSRVEATSYKNSVKYLGQLFEYKREKAKAKDPKAYDAFDAKSKLYFGVFDKL